MTTIHKFPPLGVELGQLVCDPVVLAHKHGVDGGQHGLLAVARVARLEAEAALRLTLWDGNL